MLRKENQPMIGSLFFALLVSGPWGLNAVAQPSGSFVATGNMTTPRGGFTATLLNDGRVLITGGFGGQTVVASAELYDPSTGKFITTSAMSTPRAGHTATLLTDGQVLIAGGSSGVEPSAELYNPSTGTFTSTGSMVDGQQGGHAATLLKDGKVLISGGVLYPSGRGLPTGPTAPSLYDPATGKFAPAGHLNGTRQASTATLLDDGTVLIAGGWRDGDLSVYDPASGNLTVLGALPIWSHTATLLANGTALFLGGATYGSYDGCDDPGEELLRTSLLYDPRHTSFQATGSLLQPRAGHSATLLASGLVLVAGGDSSYHAELYDPVSGTFTDAGKMNESRGGHTATLLRDGKVLLTGGDGLGTAEIYVPPPDPWQQAFTAMKAAAGTDSFNFWQWAWFWQRSPAFPGAPAGFGVLGSISIDQMGRIVAGSGGDGSQLISAEQWVLYYQQALATDPWQQTIAQMQAAAGTDRFNLWQWAWFWQKAPAFPGAPAGFGVSGSISIDQMGRIVAGSGGDGSQLISAGQWVSYFRQAIPQ